MATEPLRVRVHARRTVGRYAPWLLAFVCAALLLPFVLADGLALGLSDFKVGEPAPITVRVNALQASPLGQDGGAIAIERGALVDAQVAAFVEERPQLSAGRWIAIWAALFAALLVWTRLVGGDHRGRLLRVQLVTLGLVLVFVMVASALLLLTPVSILAIPVSLIGVLVGRRAGRQVTLATTSLGVLIVACLVPFDLGIAIVLGVQALVPAMLTPRHASLARTASMACVGSLVALAAFALAHYAAFGAGAALGGAASSTWLAAAIGAPLGAVLAQPLRPLYSWLCGDVSSPTLARLERLSQPLLKQIATQSPGTWQHSLAMASLAQAAGRSVGADLQLLRVGAYYHDLGKSLQPKYFIENLEGGEVSVHDKLSPEASRDGIFAHVNDGVTAARDAGLPDRVIDFIVSHHGGGVLEYFWAKQGQGDGKPETVESFCYPGSRPQCPETGIMCICDAIEGATRSLKSPTRGEIEDVVDHIVFGKMRMGQLVECGLSLAELLRIRDALCQALFTAHAPVQNKSKGADAISTANARLGRASAAPSSSPSPSLASLHAIRLDSLDRPSASWHAEVLASASSERVTADMALANTENLNEDMAFGQTEVIAPAEAKQDELSQEEAEEPEMPFPESAAPVEKESSRPSPTASSEALTTLLGRPEVKARGKAPADDKVEAVEVLLLKRPKVVTESKNPPTSMTPPPPPPKRFTIPLGEGEPTVRPEQGSRRADSQDGLRPGEIVLGAPPATHPERTQKRDRYPDEVTALRPMPLPTEARRPEDRITQERPIMVPPEAFGEDTIPRTSRPGTDSDDPESGF